MPNSRPWLLSKCRPNKQIGRPSGFHVTFHRENLLTVRNRLVQIIIETERSAFRFAELKPGQLKLRQNVSWLRPRENLNVCELTLAVCAGDRDSYLFHCRVSLLRIWN